VGGEGVTTETLAKHHGSWAGTNSFRLTPVDAPHVAAATAQVSSAAGGGLTTITYTWTHPEDGAVEGLLVVGADDDSGDEPGRVIALWGDSWHQAPQPRTLTGTFDESTVTVGYTYAENWRWIITVDTSDPEVLHLRMDNVVPESAAAQGYTPGAYWAMDAALRVAR
jgi:hypothetical protein